MAPPPSATDEFEAFWGKAVPAAAPHRQAHRQESQAGDRLLLVIVIFLGAFGLLTGRLIELTLLRPDEARIASIGPYIPPPMRAEILDRNGEMLATNLNVASLYANPAEVWDVHEAVTKLARIFPALDSKKTEERLTAKGQFIWIKRDLRPEEAAKVRNLGLPGLYFVNEQRRAYLQGPLFAHVMGGVDIDNKGTSGVEKALEARITKAGAGPLTLSLDVSVQHALRDTLAAARIRYKAKGAAGLVLDANTGELLAMTSLPDFDPNLPGDPKDDARLNRASLGVYEMGSTFKILTTAMALDSRKVTLKNGYDASKPIHIGRYTIHDFHPENRWLTVEEIFLHSSNIGSAKMALDCGVETHQAFLRKLGIMDRPGIELAEVGRPLVPARWAEINTMTIAFGHGLSVSPIGLVKAVMPIVNGGTLIEPTLVKHEAGAPVPGRRVLRADTSTTMKRLMREVVQKGTGSKADVPGYDVGGKTGTADKAEGRGYNRQHAVMASFLAIFPAQAPRYVVLVMIDEPQGTAETHGLVTAGMTAAPTAAEVIKRVAPILRVNPVWDSAKTVLASN
jgi:cell division protein FtsI (penicillin-binding protein 3)